MVIYRLIKLVKWIPKRYGFVYIDRDENEIKELKRIKRTVSIGIRV